MRKWHELWGKEATYLKLEDGLRQIGRRDLIEFVVGLLRRGGQQLANKEPQRAPAPLHNWCNFRFSCLRNIGLVLASLFVVLILTIVLMSYNLSTVNDKLSLTEHYNNNIITSTRQNQDNVTTYLQKTTMFHIRNCSFPENDLPTIHPPFIGRENDIYQVLRRVANAHIVNINGAPGFGKSTLAIYIGYEIFKNGTSVRYINVEDKVSSIVNQLQKSEGEAMPEFTSNTNVHQAQTNALIEFRRFLLSVMPINPKLRSKYENFFEELQMWSETIKCTSVLILDNCDDILVSPAREKFLSLINSLVLKSHFLLHIIIVSHEKLLYLDSFDSWIVRELNQSASVQLLDKLAPAIDNESLVTVAELVEGCPLALKVIGQLLHIHGALLIQKMKIELITILDKASDQKQRFRAIMNVAFNGLGDLKDCGHVLSLFPGSFDESAGNAIVQEKCLETYVKHSLLNDYSLALNYRYKMHRLIKEYLQEKISISEYTTFKTRFRKYFETLLLTFAKKQEIDDMEKYALSLESHNLLFLGILLLNDIHTSSEKLAILALLVDVKLMQLEQLYGYYALYIKKLYEVCLLLNSKLCGQLYTNVVSHLYQQCKCETIMAYVQNLFVTPCTEHFQCEVVSYLQELHILRVLQLSDNELSYITVVAGSYCNTGRVYRAVGIVLPLNLIIYIIILLYGVSNAYGVKCMRCVLFLCLSLELVLHIFYEYYDVNIVTVPHLRIWEIILFCLCQYAIFSFAIFVMHTAIVRMRLFRSRLTITKAVIIFLIIVIYICIALYTHILKNASAPRFYTHILKNASAPRFCCQLISPICF